MFFFTVCVSHRMVVTQTNGVRSCGTFLHAFARAANVTQSSRSSALTKKSRENIWLIVESCLSLQLASWFLYEIGDNCRHLFFRLWLLVRGSLNSEVQSALSMSISTEDYSRSSRSWNREAVWWHKSSTCFRLLMWPRRKNRRANRTKAIERFYNQCF